MSIEAAGERAECGQDQLVCRGNKTTSRHLPPSKMQTKLWMEVTRDFRPGIDPFGLVAKNDPRNDQFVLEPTAAMISKTRVVIAQNPDPVEAGGEIAQQLARVPREALATEPVMKAVAEAEEPLGACRLDGASQRAERRLRIIWWQELSEAREPACLLEVQIGNQQRFLGRPEERAVSGCEESLAGERKGNHEADVTPAPNAD